jgi:hypothetical protein
MEEEGNVKAAHFKRFYDVYTALPATFDPSLQVASNPNTTEVPVVPPTDPEEVLAETRLRPGRITNKVTLLWAHLFNVRYRMLLTDLQHALSLPLAVDANRHPVAPGTAGAQATPRSNLVTWVYEDMLQQVGSVRGLAGILVTLNQTDLATDGNAGPTFELPFSLDLPDRPQDRWDVHRALNKTTQSLVASLQGVTTDANLKDTLTQIGTDADKRLKEIDPLAATGF